jgi:hypothetical protein
MNKFKDGDKIVVKSKEACAQIYDMTFGKEYGVYIYRGALRFNDDNGDRRDLALWESEFKLAEPNQMPELEAGMVVECFDGDFELMLSSVVSAVLGNEYGIYSAERGGVDKGGIKAVYENPLCGLSDIVGSLGAPIWEATPEKTPAQLKAEELEKTITEAQEQLKELSKEL